MGPSLLLAGLVGEGVKKRISEPRLVPFLAVGFEESRSQERCGLDAGHVCGNARVLVLLPFPTAVA